MSIFLFVYFIAGIVALMIRLYNDVEFLDEIAEMSKSENLERRLGCICGLLIVVAIWPVMIVNQIFDIHHD